MLSSKLSDPSVPSKEQDEVLRARLKFDNLALRMSYQTKERTEKKKKKKSKNKKRPQTTALRSTFEKKEKAMC